MGFWIGMGRKARQTYGFDDIALVPGDVTINPDEVNTSLKIGKINLNTPIMASAMDGVVDVRFAIAMGKLGAMAVLNLEGVQTRYNEPESILKRISESDDQEATRLVQELYLPPIKEELVARRIKEIKKAGVMAAVSSTPQRAERFGEIAQKAGADIYFVQSTVASVRHESTRYKTLDFKKFCKKMKIPVVAGNTVTFNSTLELMQTGVAAVLVGVGPGAACTTRGVLGVGVPQVTATVDCAAARDFYYKETARYVPIITDGGMSVGGDICKAFACGADGVMVGSAFARAKEAPGKGFHWGMATPHQNLPRGTRVRVGTTGSLEEILFGPARMDDGSQNLVGALENCMGICGAKTIREMQRIQIIIAQSLKTEGKIFQRTQRVGMGKS